MDKKNTLLLTVIAIATLLVAVVGATFAYFSAQVGSGKTTTMNIKTVNEDSVTFNASDPLYLIANQTNFADVSQHAEENVGSQKGVSTASVELLRGDAGDKKYCYTTSIKVSQNDFKYATYTEDFFQGVTDEFKPTSLQDKKGELFLKVTKVSKTGTRETDFSSGEGTKTEYTYNVTNPEIKYVTVDGERRVCTQTGTNAGYTGASYKCDDGQTVAGWDITEWTTGDIAIPTTNEAPESNEATTTEGLRHSLSANAANAKVVDQWTAELVFVNFNWDQQYNVGKQFIATWEFKSVDCDTGAEKN